HTSFSRDWSSDVCSSDLAGGEVRIVEVAQHLVFIGSAVFVIGAHQPAQAGCAVVRQPQFLVEGFDEAIVLVEIEGDERIAVLIRSEERRVGKEGGSRWAT